MKTKLKALLKHKKPGVYAVGDQATVLDAVRVMNEHRVGAVLVMDGDRLVGIFTERDVLARVVDSDRDPTTLPVRDVMTGELVTVGPDVTVEEALAVVSSERCRHLPVMDGDVLLGVVSAGDLTRRVVTLQADHIRDLTNYITRRYPV